MRKQPRNTGLLLVWLGVLATPVSADIVRLKIHFGFRTPTGGEFLVEPISGLSFTPAARAGNPVGWYETFSVEKNDPIRFGRRYFGVINDEALGGGRASNPDPLDPKTAYLYQKFIDGDLAGYDFGAATQRAVSAEALQDVIWHIEGEQAWNPSWTASTQQYAFYQDALANAGSTIGNVRIVNIYRNVRLTRGKQDQLIIIPAPGAALLGVIGFCLICRRTRRNA